MIVWMYYETDGDSGHYNIRLFSTEEKARAHKERTRSDYGRVKEVRIE